MASCCRTDDAVVADAGAFCIKIGVVEAVSRPLTAVICRGNDEDGMKASE